MIEEGCENKYALLIIFIYLFLLYHKKSKLTLEDKNLKWGGYHYKINVVFSQIR